MIRLCLPAMVLLLTACAMAASPLPPMPTSPSPPIAPATPADTGWARTEPGLERREIFVPVPASGMAERLVIFRVEPAYFAFRVRYTPGFPAFVSGWDKTARLVFNAGYFDENDAALGLLVTDGQRFGNSYEGFGGMFTVDAGGAVTVRALAVQPYRPEESLLQAVQNFPLLVYPDGSIFTKEDGARARRTVLGQDSAGRIVLVVAPIGAFTLAELGAWLRGSDLGLAVALNLDGGGSTGYYAGPDDVIDSFTPVPAAIAVYARE